MSSQDVSKEPKIPMIASNRYNKPYLLLREMAERLGCPVDELEDWLNDSLLEVHGAGLEIKRVRIEIHVGVKQ